jgi:S-adenosylmethionine decarboxylase proenzyme
MIGKHCIVHVRNIQDISLLETIHCVKPILATIVRECDLHSVAEAGHQFQPVGVTYVHVLEESHLSIHTYPENASCYIDIFCCNESFDPQKSIDVIKREFSVGDDSIEWQVITR